MPRLPHHRFARGAGVLIALALITWLLAPDRAERPDRNSSSPRSAFVAFTLQ